MSTINLTLVNILQITFCIQSVFAIVILFPNLNNRRLIHLLLACAFLMAFNLLEERRITYDFYLITPSFSLVFGPLFYFLVRQLALNELTTKLSHLYHLIPALLSLLLTDNVQLVIAIGTVSQLIYFIRSLELLGVYKQACFYDRSDALSLQLDWLRNIIIAMLIITSIDLLRLNLQPLLNSSLGSYWYFTMQLAFYLLMNYLVVQAIWQPSRYTGLQHYLDQQKKTAQNKLEAKPIFDQLDQIIITEDLFKQPRLSLQDLSDRLGLSSKDISWAINEGCQLNFCDYINNYRIEDIKAKLAINSKLNMLQIALEAGFNSKSSFNKSFKKQVNMTPSQYVQSIKS
jgi:AraC-like DNA-binding protein